MSADIRERLLQTAAEPTRPLDTTAVVGKARRQRRIARTGAATIACLVLVSAALALPVLYEDRGLRIADRPGPSDAPAAGLELGEAYVWRAAGGSAEDAGRAFAAEVLGWDSTTVSDPAFGPPDGLVHLVLDGPDDRSVELYLTRHDEPAGWDVSQVSAGLHQPISVSETPSLRWRPSIPGDTDKTGLFEGETGVAYLRTAERGMVAIPVDADAVAAGEVSLAGHIDIGVPFCHNIQSMLLLFFNNAGQVASAVGGIWSHEPRPDCQTAPGQHVDGPDRWLTADSAGADSAPDTPQFAPPPEVTVEDAPAGTADRFAAAHDLTIERASITRFGDDTAAVDLALRDPTADVIVSVMLKQLAAPEPREAWLESATDWDHFRDGDLEILQAVSERFERIVAVTPTGLRVAVTITPPPRQAALPVHSIDTLALATAALDDPSLTDPARRKPG